VFAAARFHELQARIRFDIHTADLTDRNAGARSPVSHEPFSDAKPNVSRRSSVAWAHAIDDRRSGDGLNGPSISRSLEHEPAGGRDEQNRRSR
jgi:hypothetical protein